jgi:hypothetical protein
LLDLKKGTGISEFLGTDNCCLQFSSILKGRAHSTYSWGPMTLGCTCVVCVYACVYVCAYVHACVCEEENLNLVPRSAD